MQKFVQVTVVPRKIPHTTELYMLPLPIETKFVHLLLPRKPPDCVVGSGGVSFVAVQNVRTVNHLTC